MARRLRIQFPAVLQKPSGAPYRWIAEKLRLDRPASVRAAVCWLGRR
jgi:hypothetical protein